MIRKMTSNEINLFSQSIADIKISWILFKQNIKAFISTEIFAFIAAIVSIGIISTITYLIFDSNEHLAVIISVLGFILTMLVLRIFLTAQYGLAYDIISSGNMYTELKSAFTYFRKSWWRYFIIILISNIIEPSSFNPAVERGNHPVELSVINFNIYIFVIFIFLDFMWHTLFIHTLPAISKHNNLKLAFKENFKLIRYYSKRIFTTWFLILLIFDTPLIVLSFIFDYFVASEVFEFVFIIILLIFVVILELIKFPMSSLAATRIYNLLEEIPEIQEEYGGTIIE